MIPIDQEIVGGGSGDCLRAAYASLLELPIDAVPNFIRHGPRWFLVFNQFLWACGYEFSGTGYRNSYHPCNTPLYEHTFKGRLKASVHSRVIKDGTHSVVINCDGLVIHDPSPYKRHQGINVFTSDDFISFDIVRRRTDKAWDGWSCKKGVTK